MVESIILLSSDPNSSIDCLQFKYIKFELIGACEDWIHKFLQMNYTNIMYHINYVKKS